MTKYDNTYQGVEDLCIREFGWAGKHDGSSGFLCFCPVHGDKSESLAVNLSPDGAILIVCRSHGCNVYAYVSQRKAWPQTHENAVEMNERYIRKYPERAAIPFVWNSVPVSHSKAQEYARSLKDSMALTDDKTKTKSNFEKASVHIYTDGKFTHSIIARYNDRAKILPKRIFQYSFGYYTPHPDLPDGKPTDPNSPKFQIKGWRNEHVKHMLYAVTLLRAKLDSTVVVVEGEKAADFGNSYIGVADRYPDYVFTTWKGGSQTVEYSDWSELKDRNVIILPDNDAPGYSAASNVKAALESVAKSVRTVDLSHFNLPKGWDIADYRIKGLNAPKFLELIAVNSPEYDENGEYNIGNDNQSNDGREYSYEPGPTTSDNKPTSRDNKLSVELSKTESIVFWYKHDQSHITDMQNYMERYALLKEGSSTKVVDVREHVNRNRTTIMSIREFHEATLSIRIVMSDKGKPQQASAIWLSGSTNKIDQVGFWAVGDRIITEVDYATGKIITKLNMWTGPAAATKDQSGDDTPIMEHIKFVFSGEKTEIADQLLYYFMCCLAEAVQKPTRRRGKVFIFGGAQGSGKSTILKVMYRIFGPQNALLTSNIKDIVGDFNYQLCGKAFVGLEEISFRKGDFYNRIKELSTAVSTMVTEKNKTSVMHNMFVWFMATTNEEYMAPIADSERRIIPITVPPTYAIGHSPQEVIDKYFNNLHKCIDNGGAEAFYMRLMKFELPTRFPAIPETQAYASQMRETQSYSKNSLFADWYEDCLYNKRISGDQRIEFTSGKSIIRKTVWTQFESWQLHKIQYNRTIKTMGRSEFLKEFYKFCSGQVRLGPMCPYSPKGRFVAIARADVSFTMPDVNEARIVFEEVFGKHSNYDIYGPDATNQSKLKMHNDGSKENTEGYQQ